MSALHVCHFKLLENIQPIMDSMLEASQYWQPDKVSQTISEQGHCAFAKASLFNTPESQYDDVFKEPETGMVVIANARLDNRSALAESLAIDDAALSLMGDSLLILKAYQQWGESCPKHLLGDFVFIIWDESLQQLFCARDHFGIKVLFYAVTDKGIMLTNEHGAFFNSHWLPKVLDEHWLVDRLWGLGSKPFESPYQGIAVLPAAHSLVIDAKGLRLQRFWQLTTTDVCTGMDDEAIIKALKNRFNRAVKRRLRSDYALGAELSEGLDSNGIVGFAAKALGEQTLHTFSYQCEKETAENSDVWHDTYQDIYGMVAMYDNVVSIWSDSKSQQYEQKLMAFFHHFGGLLDISGGHFLRSGLAKKQGIRTLLSGWGGDHCVTSYGNFYDSELLSKGRFIALYRTLKGMQQRKRGAHPFKSFIRLLMKHYMQKSYRQFLRSRQGLENALLTRASRHFLSQSFRDKYHCDANLDLFVDQYNSGKTVQAHEQRELFDIGLEGRLVESELCGRVDKVEYRYPMLDVELVEFAHNIPGHLKLHKGLERYHFRRVLDGVTTPRIQWRAKADVDHPKIDRSESLTKEAEHLQKELMGNPWVEKFCDQSSLDALFKNSYPMLLITLKLLVYLEKDGGKVGEK